jgi:Putative beta-lactamase-inhibitor-like, PepSY-like
VHPIEKSTRPLFIQNIKEMKNLKLFMITLAMLTVVLSIKTTAQTNDTKAIPQVVTASFKTKYPGVEIKRWKTENNKYVAKATIDNHKCFASFDANGNWLNTTSRIAWPWKLPKTVKEAFGRTKYNNWHIYTVMKVEKPSGESYALMIDNGNLQIDATHQSVVPSDKLLEFKSDGILTQVIDVSGDPVAYATVLH